MVNKLADNKTWVIKLGSGGVCIPFCEERKIVGLGWKMVKPDIVAKKSKEVLWDHIKERCQIYAGEKKKISQATGQLYRFGQECQIGDYIFYYDPPNKLVKVCRVVSESRYRDFDENQDVDIWHYRKVEYPTAVISILDFYGSLKGSLLGPRMSFWEMRGGLEYVQSLILGRPLNTAADKDFTLTYRKLKTLLVKRAEALNHKDWEFVVADFFRSKGAIVDEQQVGGSRPIIDLEALFDRGELGQELWRTQVKCIRSKQIDWADIERDFKHIGESRFCYVSVFGFTKKARQYADENEIVLLEASDFADFFISGQYRQNLKDKLRLN